MITDLAMFAREPRTRFGSRLRVVAAAGAPLAQPFAVATGDDAKGTLSAAYGAQAAASVRPTMALAGAGGSAGCAKLRISAEAPAGARRTRPDGRLMCAPDTRGRRGCAVLRKRNHRMADNQLRGACLPRPVARGLSCGLPPT